MVFTMWFNRILWYLNVSAGLFKFPLIVLITEGFHLKTSAVISHCGL